MSIFGLHYICNVVKRKSSWIRFEMSCVVSCVFISFCIVGCSDFVVAEAFVFYCLAVGKHFFGVRFLALACR